MTMWPTCILFFWAVSSVVLTAFFFIQVINVICRWVAKACVLLEPDLDPPLLTACWWSWSGSVEEQARLMEKDYAKEIDLVWNLGGESDFLLSPPGTFDNCSMMYSHYSYVRGTWIFGYYLFIPVNSKSCPIECIFMTLRANKKSPWVWDSSVPGHFYPNKRMWANQVGAQQLRPKWKWRHRSDPLRQVANILCAEAGGEANKDELAPYQGDHIIVASTLKKPEVSPPLFLMARYCFKRPTPALSTKPRPTFHLARSWSILNVKAVFSVHKGNVKYV